MNHEDAKKKQGSKEPGVEGKVKNSSVPNLDDWLEIGKIVSPQGLIGELRVYPNTDFPERFEEPGKRWLLRPGETELQPVELLNFTDSALFTFLSIQLSLFCHKLHNLKSATYEGHARDT